MSKISRNIKYTTKSHALVLSSGFKNFHMLMTAEEAFRHGRLTGVICGAYPTLITKKLLCWVGLYRYRKIERLLKREVDIKCTPLKSVWWAEAIFILSVKVEQLLGRKTKRNLLGSLALYLYQSAAKRMLYRNFGGMNSIYHFRAAFGLSSVRYAKNHGFITLCDHSLADPRVLKGLIEGNSRWGCNSAEQLSFLERKMLEDINEADAVLVNSEFVKETMVYCGFSPDKIHVIYLGVDDAFVRTMPPVDDFPKQDLKLKMIFAGFFSERKGADLIVEALKEMDDVDWNLEIAGVMDASLYKRYPEFFNDSRVNVRGMLLRQELSSAMVDNNVFLFPTRAEGSARVIFEALACGCYVITTKEAGSIVVDDVHGKLIQSNNIASLKKAIIGSSLDLKRVVEIGKKNSSLILSHYRQEHYGEKLNKLYEYLHLENGSSQ